jgi:hypothetical protein
MTPVDPQLPDDSDERDAHLLAALRHAPDRDALPPPAVSATILANARAAVQGSAVPQARRWWQALDAWVMRPQWAAAFGTLAVAALVGLMWSVYEAPPPLEPKTAPAAPQAMPAPARAPAPEQDAALDKVARAQSQSAAAESRDESRDSRMREPGAVLRGATESERARAASPPPRSSTLSKAGAAAEARSTRPAEPDAVAALRGNATTVPNAEQRAMADEAGARAGADSPPLAAAPADAAGRMRQEAAAPAAAAKRAAAPDDPLLRLNALLARAASDVAWRSAGKAWPHGPEQRRWWAQLRQTTRGHWQRDERGSDAFAPWLVLTLGSAEEAAFRTDGNTLQLQLDGTRWQAALPEPTLRELRDAVSRW